MTSVTQRTQVCRVTPSWDKDPFSQRESEAVLFHCPLKHHKQSGYQMNSWLSEPNTPSPSLRLCAVFTQSTQSSHTLRKNTPAQQLHPLTCLGDDIHYQHTTQPNRFIRSFLGPELLHYNGRNSQQLKPEHQRLYLIGFCWVLLLQVSLCVWSKTSLWATLLW